MKEVKDGILEEGLRVEIRGLVTCGERGGLRVRKGGRRMLRVGKRGGYRV